MKSHGIVLVVVFSILNLISPQAKCQFKDAVVTDNPVGLTPVFANNTGNFIYETGGTTYMVNVWDDANGNNSALSWKVGTATGFVSIDPSINVIDPDVCLVKNSVGTIYAIVVYYSPNTNMFMMRNFNWVPASQQFVGATPITLVPGQYANSINIDSDDAGDFVIVWDQVGQQIQLIIGTTPPASSPQLISSGAVTLDSGTMPDVCFFRDGTTSYKQVDVTFINLGSLVAVDFYRFADLLTGTLAPQQVFRSGNADLTYRTPRIDCPAPGFGSQSMFTVVVEDSDNLSSWYIKGFNSNTCCPGFTAITYNDGSSSNSPYNLTDVANTKPVVAYQNNADGIIVGWNFDNSFGLLGAPGASVARYPIALSCDKRAKIYSASKYLVIPISITTGSEIGKLSISGRFSSSGLYTYLNNFNNDIFYKAVPHVVNAGYLKTGTATNFQEWLNNLTLVDNVSNVDLTAYDLLGKQVFYFEGTPEVLITKWSAFSKSAPAGIYAARSLNISSNSGFTGKIFIGN